MISFHSAPRAPRARTGLACALVCSLLVAPAVAQTGLAPVVVVATREPQPLDRVAADVVVIDAERIRDAGADTLEDLLRREAGLQLSRNGGPGHMLTGR